MDEIVNFDTLLALIDDRDKEVYEAVCRRILEAGPDILPVLEHAITTSANVIQYERLEKLIYQLKVDKLILKTTHWMESAEKNLLEGWILISSIQHPTILSDKVEALIDKLVKDIWLELNDSLTSIEKISVINHIFFEIYGFSINSDDLLVPENCLINNLLVTRKGNFYSLTLLYCIVAKRLELPIVPIGTPTSLVLGYYQPDIAREVYGEDSDAFLFYINLEHRGAIVGAKEINYILHDRPEGKIFQLVLNHETLMLNLIRHLRSCYEAQNNEEKVSILNKLLNKIIRK